MNNEDRIKALEEEIIIINQKLEDTKFMIKLLMEELPNNETT